MNAYLSAIKDFCTRYFYHFCEIWKIRHTLDTPIREENEYDFLPAHLELMEKPVPVLPRYTARIIIAFIIMALIWSIVGKVDIVSTATGKLIYSGHSKVIQPIENAIVNHIDVTNGQTVKAGELLVELTSLGAEEELKKANVALGSARLAKARASALLESIESRQLPHLTLNEKEISKSEIHQAEQLITAQFNTFILQTQKAESLLTQKKAEHFTTQMQKEKHQSLLKLEELKLADLTKLYQQKGISKHQYLEQKEKCIELKKEISALESKLNEISAEINQAESEENLLTNNFIRDEQDALRQANEQIEQLVVEQAKQTNRRNTTQIKSPVDGTIQQLSVHTVGGVVTAAQPLMVIVPKEDRLEVEALISNNEIGFIQPNQSVTIKIEAFPYTRYGYITGKVKSVSFDGIENEKLGLVFSTIIEMDQDYLLIEDKPIHLTAGMTVNAEIKTGRRSVISYLLSPLQSSVTESFRER